MPEEHHLNAENNEPPRAPGHDARAIIASLRAAEPDSTEVFEAFWQLDRLPEEEVREALTSWVGPLPDLDRLEPALRLKHGLGLRLLQLRALSVDRDADILDLGPIAEEQLRIAGKSWDGEDRSAEDRLDGELEGSFAGTLERRVLADAEAPGEPPLFDVISFGEGSGVVFSAGTTKVVALVAYGHVEMRDRRTRIAIEEAIRAPEAKGAVSGHEAKAPEMKAPKELAMRATETETAAKAVKPQASVSKQTRKPRVLVSKKKAVKPAAKVSKKTVKPAAKVSKKTVKPAAKVSKKGVKPRASVSKKGVRPAAKASKKTVKPAVKASKKGVKPAARVARKSAAKTKAATSTKAKRAK